MTQLRLTLLGGVTICLDDQALEGLASRKAQALLCYLAVTSRPHSRSALAGLLWSDIGEANARMNLRKELTRLTPLFRPHLSISRDRIAFDRASDYVLDVEAFDALTIPPAKGIAHPPQDAPTVEPPNPGSESPTAVDRLAAAVALYQGDFLEGFYVQHAPLFEEWVLIQRATLRDRAMDALHRLAAIHTRQGDSRAAIRALKQLLTLEPWREDARRQLMRLYAENGQRSLALIQYETCRQVLAEELDVEPSEETTDLYVRIRDGKPTGEHQPANRAPPHEVIPRHAAPSISPPDATTVALPPFLASAPAREAAPPLFVARERVLEQLHGFLELATNSAIDGVTNGQGRVVFVTGEAGSGKTSLVHAFMARAQEQHSDLIAVISNCNAFVGVSDPYLPFREILALLTGDVEALWASGLLTRNHALRLWNLLPHTIQALVERGPDLIDTFLSSGPLIHRAETSLPDAPGALQRLRAIAREKSRGGQGPHQSRIFEEYTNVLESLSARQPLLIILDDLHWADLSSLSLLFHLGHRIRTCPILIVCALRPEEMTLAPPPERAETRPLPELVNEFKRYYGDVQIDLDQTNEDERARFMRAVLDAEPNRLGEDFRHALFQRTQGHPLFTVELLRNIQERGDLVHDADGRWIEGSTPPWNTLPARVEGVIAKRIDRLDHELYNILAVASVEGETFTAQVIAKVLAHQERPLLQQLSQKLEKRHRLVHQQAEIRLEGGGQRLSRYRFGHVLFQQYLHNQLSAGERRLLHGEVALALREFYGDDEEIVVQLAHHFTLAEDWPQAFHYLRLCGDKARRTYANQEAIEFYTRALDASRQATTAVDDANLLLVYEGRGRVHTVQSSYDEAIADFERMRNLARASGSRQKEGESLCHLAFAHWAKFSEEQLPFVEEYAQEALRLAQGLADQKILARGLTSLGLVNQARGNLRQSDKLLIKSLRISRRKGYQDALAPNLLWLSAHAYWRGDFADAVHVGQEALEVARDIHEGFIELLSHSFLCLSHWSAGDYAQAFAALRECMAEAQLRGNTFIIGRLTNTLGWFHSEFGDVAHALEYDAESVELGREAKNANVEISALINVGIDYLELGRHQQALSYLQPALERVERETFGTERWRWRVRLLLGIAETWHSVGDHEQAHRYAQEAIQQARATASQKYIAKGEALRGKALIALGQPEAGGHALRHAYAIAQRLHSPTLLHPLAYELARWSESQGQIQHAADLYAQAHATVEQMAASVENQRLQTTLLQSEPVQLLAQSLARTR